MLQMSSETALRSKFSTERPCIFGTLVRALVPVKPQVWLADKLGCTERGALMLINGERKVTARCVAVIVNEIIA